MMKPIKINKISYNANSTSDINEKTLKRLNGIAASQLNILENFMSFQNLKQCSRRLRFSGGIVIECLISFGRRKATIYIPDQDKPKIIKKLIPEKEYLHIICGESVLVWDILEEEIVYGPCSITDELYLNWLTTTLSVGTPLFTPSLQGEDSARDIYPDQPEEPCSCISSSGSLGNEIDWINCFGEQAEDFVYAWEATIYRNSGGFSHPNCVDWETPVPNKQFSIHVINPVCREDKKESLRLDFANNVSGATALNIKKKIDEEIGNNSYYPDGWYNYNTVYTYEVMSPFGLLGEITKNNTYAITYDIGTGTWIRSGTEISFLLEQGYAGSFSSESLCQIYYSIRQAKWRTGDDLDDPNNGEQFESEVAINIFASCSLTNGQETNPINETRNIFLEIALTELLIYENSENVEVNDYNISDLCSGQDLLICIPKFQRFAIDILSKKESS